MKTLFIWLTCVVGIVLCKEKVSENSALLAKLLPKSDPYSCFFDWDCKGGYCCSSIIPGCIGYCISCAKDELINIGSEPLSSRCIEDWDCEGGWCCSSLQPGLEGDCVPCGGGKKSNTLEKATPKCIEDWDCEGGWCCSALQPGLEGDCVPCGIR